MDAGGLPAGVSFGTASDPTGEWVALGVGFVNNPSAALGPDLFAADATLSFDPPVQSVSFTLLKPVNDETAATCTATVSAAGGSSAVVELPCSSADNTVSIEIVATGDSIASVVFDEQDALAELFDDMCFVAESNEADSDGDGVPDSIDLCPDSVTPEPTFGAPNSTAFVLWGSYAVTRPCSDFLPYGPCQFEGGRVVRPPRSAGGQPAAPDAIRFNRFSMADTGGCTCDQITAEYLAADQGYLAQYWLRFSRAFGCPRSLLVRWIEGLAPAPAPALT